LRIKLYKKLFDFLGVLYLLNVARRVKR